MILIHQVTTPIINWSFQTSYCLLIDDWWNWFNVWKYGHDHVSIRLYVQANKPLMERRRRARINNSLSVLKSIILQDKDSATTEVLNLSKGLPMLNETLYRVLPNDNLNP